MLKGGGGKGFDAKGPNQAMLNDVMGGTNEGYGDEDDKPFKREEEGEFDFMWAHNFHQSWWALFVKIKVCSGRISSFLETRLYK